MSFSIGPTGENPLGCERVSRGFVPAEPWPGEFQSLQHRTQVVARGVLVDVLAVAPHRRDDAPFPAGLELPLSEHREKWV